MESVSIETFPGNKHQTLQANHMIYKPISNESKRTERRMALMLATPSIVSFVDNILYLSVLFRSITFQLIEVNIMFLLVEFQLRGHLVSLEHSNIRRR